MLKCVGWHCETSPDISLGRKSMAFNVLLPCTRPKGIRRTRCHVTMARRKSFRTGGGQKTSGPSATPPEKKAEIEQIAKVFGILPTQPGQDLDQQYNTEDAADSASGASLYTALASAVGTDTLDTIEVGTIWTLGGLLAAFIALGLGISSAAYYTAASKPIPAGLDSFLNSVEPLFTPLLVAFLVLSSIFGLYKQSQLNSGATGYDDKL